MIEFPYKQLESGVIRPIIPVEVGFGSQRIQIEALVDSGADICVFDAAVAEYLGIDLMKGTPTEVAGVTGVPELLFVQSVDLLVGPWQRTVPIGFLARMGQYGYGVLGQQGLFDWCDVTFRYQEQQIELRARTSE